MVVVEEQVRESEGEKTSSGSSLATALNWQSQQQQEDNSESLPCGKPIRQTISIFQIYQK